VITRHVVIQEFTSTPEILPKITDSDLLDQYPADPLRNVYFPSKDLEMVIPGETGRKG